MSSQNWEHDIQLAKTAHIDGFALNIAPSDSFTDTALQKAYAAAESVGGFYLFLSFDYLSQGPWSAEQVISATNTYKNYPAQFVYKGRPFVSTFEGTNNVLDWPGIIAGTGCFAVPSWTSLGPGGLAPALSYIDGMFSWDAWPEGASNMVTTSDEQWINALGGKTYMMPVSPWFYTNLPQWDKNWLWRGDDLWHDRWQQIIEMQPPLVEIITWNDYGETHYIGPIHEQGIPEGAADYVAGNPHDAWRKLLPYYIDAYKSGNVSSISQTDNATTSNSLSLKFNAEAPAVDALTYWYRLNPSDAGSSGGTTGNNPAMGQPVLNPGAVSQDKVFVTAVVTAPSEVTIQIGTNAATTFHANHIGINHFSVPFNGHTGPVHFAIVRKGHTVASATGPAITNDCQDGRVNWNAYVGSSNTTSSNVPSASSSWRKRG